MTRVDPQPFAVQVDNTILAGAGRMLYPSGHTQGASHAKGYYGKYPDARFYDSIALSELLTALLLFDRVYWDSASVGDEQEFWVYMWFPIFNSLRTQGILQHFARDSFYSQQDEDWGYSEDYVEPASLIMNDTLEFAVSHVIGLKGQSSLPLPKGFKMPLCYSSTHHEYYEAARDKFEELDYAPEPADISMALFLHRGLYCQTVNLLPEWKSNLLVTGGVTDDAVAYMPHYYRGWLLSSANGQLTSILSAVYSQEQFGLRDVITPYELMQQMGQAILQTLSQGIASKQVFPTTVLGGAFLHESLMKRSDAWGALVNVLEFRDTDAGKRVRSTFRKLCLAGQSGNVASVQARIREIDREVRTMLAHKAGVRRHLSGASIVSDAPMGTWGTVYKVLAPLFEYVPEEVRTALYKASQTPVWKSKFQVILEKYFAEPEE